MIIKLSLLETLLSISGGIISILAFFGVKNFKTNYSEKKAKQLGIKFEIDELLKELSKEMTNRRVIPTLTILTNGGHKISYEGPMYLQALNSVSIEVMLLWGHGKNIIVEEIAKAIQSSK